MSAAAVITLAATGIGLVAGSVQALSFLQKQRNRRAHPAAAPSGVPSVPPPDRSENELQETSASLSSSSAHALPPRDHFALLPPDGYAVCWKQGRATTTEAAVTYALNPEDGG